MAHPDHQAQHAPYWPGRISALLPLALFAGFAAAIPPVAHGRLLWFVLDWAPALGVQIAFVLDGLSLLFALIITGIGTLVMIYADAYMAGHPHIARFYLFLHAFLLSMLGIVLSDNLLALFVFWELTTLFSFLLIGFEHESAASRESARQALLVTGAGGLALLVGILMIGQAGGHWGLLQLSASGDLLRDHALYLPILFCMLAGALTKSAQYPFHFWLPNAMTAPTPISAFLHSATMVKAGIFLLMRLHPILGGTLIWTSILVIVGAATAVWGALVSLRQTELKRLLAFTTIMALGISTMFLGGQTTSSLTAAMTFVLVHALYKSSLFLVAGNIDHQAGTRRLDAIGGLGRHMPLTAAAAGMAAMSMAGFPLFLGFIGKEIMYEGALSEEPFAELTTLAAFSANSLMTAVAAILALRPFWGKRRGQRTIVEAPWPMWSGPLLLGGIGLGFGLIPDQVSQWLIQPAVLAFHATTEEIHFKLFHGFNPPLLLSILTLSLGALIYLLRRRLRRILGRLRERLPVTMEMGYEGSLKAVLWIAGIQTRWLQNGSLFRYLMIIFAAIVLPVGGFLITSGALDLAWHPVGLSAWQGLLLLLMLAAVPVVVRATSRLLAICALGVIGAGLAVVFLNYGAPDVALTQLLVETLTLVIASLVLLRLPRIPSTHRLNPAHRSLRLMAALGSGALVTALLLAVGQYEVDRTITTFFEQASYLEAHGRNIVNVILVDFRSLDTLGEIIVVGASALAGLALIRGRKASS